MQIYILRNGQQYGPYEEAAVRGWAFAGECSLTDLAICEGRDEWQPLWTLIPAPDGTSGDLQTEFQWFEQYGVTLDSMTGKLRSADPGATELAFSQYEQLLEILRRQIASLKPQFANSSELLMMECFFFNKCAGLELFRNHMPAALELFDKSIAVVDNPGAHLVKASIYQNLNHKKECVRELDWIIANFPDHPEYAPALQMRRQM